MKTSTIVILAAVGVGAYLLLRRRSQSAPPMMIATPLSARPVEVHTLVGMGAGSSLSSAQGNRVEKISKNAASWAKSSQIQTAFHSITTPKISFGWGGDVKPTPGDDGTEEPHKRLF